PRPAFTTCRSSSVRAIRNTAIKRFSRGTPPTVHFFSRGGAGPLGRRSERRSEEHTSELQSRFDLVCRLLLEKKKTILLTWRDQLTFCTYTTQKFDITFILLSAIYYLCILHFPQV